jgi:AraC-like DNA-binding protein
MERGGSTRVVRASLGGSVWETASRAPCAALQPYVRRLVGYDERAAGPQGQRQFPQPFVVLILEFGPPLRVTLGGDERTAARYPGGFVAGLGEKFAITEHEGSQRGVQVDLTPTGARRFFDMPSSELGGCMVALHDLLASEYRTLSERLEASPSWVLRLDLVEELLARRILGSRLDTARVDWALARIEASRGNLGVGSLARELGCSHRHLIALFRDHVGIPPKLLARLVRFEQVMREAAGGARIRWSDLATTHGYFDQAHLVRDVRHFTGLTPTQARRDPSGLADLFG